MRGSKHARSDLPSSSIFYFYSLAMHLPPHKTPLLAISEVVDLALACTVELVLPARVVIMAATSSMLVDLVMAMR